MTAEEKALQKTIDDAVSKAVAEALSKVSAKSGGGTEDKASKVQNKMMYTRALNVSQSTEKVGFKPSKDHGTMVKGKIYPVSENIAEILELKELGSKCDLPKKK